MVIVCQRYKLLFFFFFRWNWISPLDENKNLQHIWQLCIYSTANKSNFNKHIRRYKTNEHVSGWKAVAKNPITRNDLASVSESKSDKDLNEQKSKLCSQCGKIFKSEFGFSLHLKNKHSFKHNHCITVFMPDHAHDPNIKLCWNQPLLMTELPYTCKTNFMERHYCHNVIVFIMCFGFVIICCGSVIICCGYVILCCGSVIICCGFVIICCGSVIICGGFVIICCGSVIICCVCHYMLCFRHYTLFLYDKSSLLWQLFSTLITLLYYDHFSLW